MRFPSLLLRQLYTFGSLANEGAGFRFSLKNRLLDVTLTGVRSLRVDDRDVPLEDLLIDLGDGQTLRASDISPQRPQPFPLRQMARLWSGRGILPEGPHEIRLAFETLPFGRMEIAVKDAIADHPAERSGLPYDKRNNAEPEIIRRRQRFVAEYSGITLQHLNRYSFEPETTRGNIENFTGVAQVPLGFAGPIRINGEHAQGEFLIPLATTEGTLVASYNRGMKVLNLAGGVTCTVVDDCMQRAPVFIFDSAREAREFRDWVNQHMEDIRRESEATSHVARLLYIDIYLSNKFAYLRFNFSTGDAAGQNMVGRATFAACSWILEHAGGIRRFYLESNLATDKKASHVNLLRTRGKRVTAEAVISRQLLLEHLRVEPECLTYHSGVANVGAFISGTNNNGLHSANGITAMYIATGQDVANVAEASSGIIYSELTSAGDLYLSMTLPSLIVATHGGGTALATQRECLAILGCAGPGKARKLAEIVAGVVLAGELSLAGAISSLEWVSAHEQYGRNR